MSTLHPGTRMSDIDATVADTPEQAPCSDCGHDAGECTCAEDAEVMQRDFERSIYFAIDKEDSDVRF